MIQCTCNCALVPLSGIVVYEMLPERNSLKYFRLPKKKPLLGRTS